jgi:putative PIN family toxin of toxin-antitoxin system
MNSPHWVLDTNVVVSGLLNPAGAPGQLLIAVRDGRIRAGWTPSILSEYASVLHRPKFRFPQPLVANLISSFAEAWEIKHTPKLRFQLPDRSDEVFLAAALGTTDKLLVTGNVKHFPAESRMDVTVLIPADAIKRLP